MAKRLLIISILTALLAQAAVSEEEPWVAAGRVRVNGNLLAGTHFVKQGKHLGFPVVTIVHALGKSASFENDTLTVEGTEVPSNKYVVVDGTPYMAWRDLGYLLPGIDYGVSADTAEFFRATPRPTPSPTAATRPTTRPTSRVKGIVMVMNPGNPGEAADMPAFQQGFYSVIEFFSSNSNDCKRWDAVLQSLTTRSPLFCIYKYDVDRPNRTDVDLESPLMQQYQIQKVPHFKVYGMDCQLISEGKAAEELIVAGCRRFGVPEDVLRQAKLAP